MGAINNKKIKCLFPIICDQLISWLFELLWFGENNSNWWCFDLKMIIFKKEEKSKIQKLGSVGVEAKG
jgi:hypothetical protein